jgi:hypothetical protein
VEAVIIVLLIGVWSVWNLITGRSKRTVLDQWFGVLLAVAMIVWLLILARHREFHRMRVYLDDTREAPEGWIRTQTPEEVIALLQTGKVEAISLDHDLGVATEERERTGYEVLRWLEEQVATGAWSFPVPEIRVHSANPVGWQRWNGRSPRFVATPQATTTDLAGRTAITL